MFKYIYFIIICLFSIGSMVEQGDFDARVAKHETCRGPKRNNCTKSTSTLDDGRVYKLDITFFEDVTVIRGKVVGLLDDKEMLRVNIRNACDHVFFRPLFQTLFNQTDRCGLLKGRHKINLNIPELTRQFYGGKSLYGNWTFTTLFYSENCNVHCDYFNVIMSPKKGAMKYIH